MTNLPAIETHNLTKKYDEFTAVNNLNFTITEGEIFGLLGPNGAGKTTLILMLLGLTEPTSGYCKVYGHDPLKEPLKIKRRCGYLPEKLGFYENITAYQNLKFFAQLNDIYDIEIKKRINEALSIVGLSNQGDNKVRTFSRGMKQRLGIANVLVKKPKIAFFDEPTQGIDPLGVNEMLDLFTRINGEEGVTIVISSHLLHQIQTICNNVGIMVKGQLVKKISLTSIDEEFDEYMIIEITLKNPEKKILDRIAEIPGVIKINQYNDTIEVECEKDLRAEISKRIIECKSELLGLGLKRRSIWDIYSKYSEDE